MILVSYKVTAIRSDDDGSGKNIVPYATVTVKNLNGTIVEEIYTNNTGTTEKSNPFTLDANGEGDFWVYPGFYTVTIAGGTEWPIFVSSTTTEDFSADEKAKLAAIQAEATKNSTDAQLRDRSTHTGTQSISTVVNLQQSLDSKLDKSSVKTNLDSPNNTEVPSTLAVASAIADSMAGETPRGAWNAATNTPALASSVGTAGHWYEVSVAGTTNLNGENVWEVGDKAIFNGLIWTRIPANAVRSIDGRSGTVIINYDTVSSLALAIDSLPIGACVSTKGCLSSGDGGHGTFDIVASTSLPVDGYTVIGSGPYAVLRPYGGVLFGAQTGVVADGTTDNRAALQRLATAAKNFRCPVQLGEGAILSVGGDINWQHPVIVSGISAGKTTIVFENMGGTSGQNGFNLVVDQGRYETSVFSNMTIQIKGAHGKYGISTPMGSAMFSTYKPRYVVDGITFKGTVESGSDGLFDYGWKRALSIGDGINHAINNINHFGCYDMTIDPALQDTDMTAIYLSCLENQGGMTMPIVSNVFTHYTGTPVYFGFRVSNPTIKSFQFHRSYWGIRSPNPAIGANYGSDEVILIGGNINAQKCGVYSAGGGFFSIHRVTSTRASGGFDHASGWQGFELNDIIDLKLYDTRAYNAGTYSNPMTGYKFSNCERITGSGFFHRGNLNKGIQIDEPEYVAIHGLQFENGTTTDGVILNRSVITNSVINISGYLEAGLVTNRYQFTGTITRKQLFDLDQTDTVVASATSISTAGTTTLTVGTSKNVQRFSCAAGAGPYTREFAFSDVGAKEGDFFEVAVSQVATNPTVVFRDGSGVLLLTIAPTGATQRHTIRARHNGGDWRIISASASLV